jgi:hypothetical protein
MVHRIGCTFVPVFDTPMMSKYGTRLQLTLSRHTKLHKIYHLDIVNDYGREVDTRTHACIHRGRQPSFLLIWLWVAPFSEIPIHGSEITLSYTAATGCADGPVPSAWIGNVPLDNSVLVVFNETYTHEAAAIDVNATHESGPSNNHILRITTGTAPGVSKRKEDPPTGCQPTTTIEMIIKLPQNYESLTIIRDGTTVTILTNDGTTDADFRLLNTNDSYS